MKWFWLILSFVWLTLGMTQAYLGNAWLALMDGVLFGLLLLTAFAVDVRGRLS